MTLGFPVVERAITGDDGRFAVLMGVYGLAKGVPKTRPATQLRCPWCEATLFHLTTSEGRIVGVTEDRKSALVDPVPPTHAVVWCFTCQLGMSVRKEVLHAGAA